MLENGKGKGGEHSEESLDAKIESENVWFFQTDALKLKCFRSTANEKKNRILTLVARLDAFGGRKIKFVRYVRAYGKDSCLVEPVNAEGNRQFSKSTEQISSVENNIFSESLDQ